MEKGKRTRTSSVQVVNDLASDMQEGETMKHINDIVRFMRLVDKYDENRFSRILLDLLRCEKVGNECIIQNYII
jgi:hypothetical protein